MSFWECPERGYTTHKKEAVRCPVCKKVLTYRFIEDKTWTHCDECRSDFFYKPHNPIPTLAMPDSKKSAKKCGCGRCGR